MPLEPFTDDDSYIETLEALPATVEGNRQILGWIRGERSWYDEVEKRHIVATLQHTDWNKSQAAAILGIERSTLDRKIKGYGLVK